MAISNQILEQYSTVVAFDQFEVLVPVLLYECFLRLRVNNQYVLPTVIETIARLATTTLWCGIGLLNIMTI